MIKLIPHILFIFVIATANAFATVNAYPFLEARNALMSPDTLEEPSGSKLAKKKRRVEGQAAQRRDFASSALKKKADKFYEALGFMAAVDLYEDLEGLEKSSVVTSKIANSYRLNGQYEDAEYYYAQIVKDTDDPEDILHYAQVLQSNGKCDDAIRWYKVYMSRSLDTRRNFIDDCDELESFKTSDVSVENVADLNSEHLDFTPIPYRDGVIFTSNRGVNRVAKRQDKWTNAHFSDLFYAKKTKWHRGQIIRW